MKTEEIYVSGKPYQFVISEIGDKPINVNEALRIDYNNIIVEAITFPVFLQQIGELLVKADNALLVAKNEFENLRDLDLRAAKGEAYTRIKDANPKWDQKQIENAIYSDIQYKDAAKKYREAQQNLAQIQKDRDFINNLYWSAKSKDEKLNKFSEKISANDLLGEIIQGEINGIEIKANEKMINVQEGNY